MYYFLFLVDATNLDKEEKEINLVELKQYSPKNSICKYSDIVHMLFLNNYTKYIFIIFNFFSPEKFK